MKMNGLCVVGTFEGVSAVLYLTPFGGFIECVYMSFTVDNFLIAVDRMASKDATKFFVDCSIQGNESKERT
jgi:hypothetical protein